LRPPSVPFALRTIFVRTRAFLRPAAAVPRKKTTLTRQGSSRICGIVIDPVCGMIRLYRLYLRITVIALMLFAALAPTVRADEYPETPDQVIQWAKDAAQTNPALRTRLLVFEIVYEVLLILDILRSRL